MTQIAIVADVHLHDLHGGYGTVQDSPGAVSLRTFTDTLDSTRVFNESYPAFIAVLSDIVRRGITDVVLLGDYSDDGQFGAVDALKGILDCWSETHGLRFFATFGNHDCYGPERHHNTKRLTDASGRPAEVVTSDNAYAAPATIAQAMQGMSTLEALEAMSKYGFSGTRGAEHWETPLGSRAGANVGVDASYLVEPQPGIWLLMLDANVFKHDGSTWRLQADRAWDHVLRERPYMLEWIADVAQRARKTGKTLLACSHYPVLPLALAKQGSSVMSACTASWQQRMPSIESGRALAEAGLTLHFSGHMHVSCQTGLDGLINVAVPSPVAYPGGYGVVRVDDAQVGYEMVPLEYVPEFAIAFPAYAAEINRSGIGEHRSLLTAQTYRDFLHGHLQNQVQKRHLPEDWPAEVLERLDSSVADLFPSATGLSPLGREISLRTMIEDYYFIRACGSVHRVPLQRVDLYREVLWPVSETSSEPTVVALMKLRFLALFSSIDGSETKFL